MFIDKVLFNNTQIIENKDKQIHSHLSNLPFKDNSQFLLKSEYKLFLKNQKPEDFDKNMHISHISHLENDEANESLVVKNYQNPNEKIEEIKNQNLKPDNNYSILSNEELVFNNLEKNEDLEKKIKESKTKEAKKTKEEKNKLLKEENKNLIPKKKIKRVSNSNISHIHNHAQIKKTDSILTSYILLLAISLHGFFEGMAFGVSTKKSETINILIAILLHKWSEALIISISLIKAKISFKRSLILMIVFTLVAPIGIFLGWFAFSFNELVVGIIKALSSGTFIYLACTEILVSEFVNSEYKYVKFLFYLIGIGFILLISLLE